jgi:hypothetical protein
MPTQPEERPPQPTTDLPRARRRWWQRLWFRVTLSIVLLACIGLFLAAEYVIRHAEPILRARVIGTLSARFHSPVELDSLHISLVKGIEVEGSGLRIRYLAGPGQPENDGGAPMLSVNHFGFHTFFRGLLRSPTRIAQVDVDGMVLHIPPSGERHDLLAEDHGRHQPKIALLVGYIRCNNVKLFIDTDKPGPSSRHKEPLEFDIQRLDLRDVGNAQPFLYRAELVNPKPIGNIDSEGHFGPWNTANPRETPLDGDYSFSHADLNTIKGIGGTLASTGHFSGVLDHINIDGVTDTPNFSLDVSDHPVPLHTVFHAYVDGTTGNTFLDPVQATLLRSSFTCRGKIVRVPHQGHDIQLDVDIPHARMQDVLRLAVKTDPPLMNGVVSMKAKLHIPPGDVRVPEKLELAGTFQLHKVSFNNPKLQNRIDGLSARAQGKPNEVHEVSTDRKAEADSQMSANIVLGHGLATITDLHYEVPGAQVLLTGVYSLDGNLFDFKGHVRTQATASQMVTGWKSWLLKPVDPFLKKNGAGLELPISISGTTADVHFGLAMHGTAEESSKDITADLHRNRQAMLEDAKAKREEEKAEHERDMAARSVDGQRARAERKAAKEERKAAQHAAESQADEQSSQSPASSPPPDRSQPQPR